jgi:hypothetical protein
VFSDITYLVDIDGNLTDARPKVNIYISSPKVHVGDKVTVSWDSANVTNCVGSDGLIGAKPNVGSSVIEPTAGGQFKYTISCTPVEGGAAINASTSLIVPMPVYKTSYENQQSINVDSNTLAIPKLHDILNRKPDQTELWFSSRIAVSDFFQEGKLSALVFSVRYTGTFFPNYNIHKWADTSSKLYFLHKENDGNWYDMSSMLIDESERFSCITPSFLEVVDLNNDKKPDVVISCTGVDFPINEMLTAYNSKQYILLSQPNLAYKLKEVELSNKIYAHQSTAVDLNNDGNVDIIYVDPHETKIPFVAWGNGDGTFIQDVTRFPLNIFNTGIYGIVAIPVNGKINVILSGSSIGTDPNNLTYGFGTRVFQYNNGKFDQIYTFKVPKVKATGLTYGLMLDAIFDNGSYYGLHVDAWYSNIAIVKYDIGTGTTTIFDNTYPPGQGVVSGDILLINKKIVNLMPDCNIHEPYYYYYYSCSLSIPIN